MFQYDGLVVGQRIRNLRVEAGYELGEFSDELGKSESHIKQSIYSMLMPKELIENVGNREFHTGEGVMLWQGSELKFIKVPVIRDEEKMKAICIDALTR